MKNKLLSTLQPKVELTKQEKNIEATEKIVEQLHEPKAKKIKQTTSVKEPKVIVTKEEKNRVEVTQEENNIAKEQNKRVTIDIPMDLNQSLRIKTVLKNITIREYILELIRKDLNVN